MDRPIMEYEEFMVIITELVAGKFGNEYTVSRKNVLKNNALTLDGLIIRKQQESIAPSIYLNRYYEQYLEGESAEEIADDICSSYYQCEEEHQESIKTGEYRFDDVENRVFYRICNFLMNQELLREIPYKRILDWAVTYHYLVCREEQEIGSFLIRNEHLHTWGVTKEQIEEWAEKNTPVLFPMTLCTMENAIAGVVKKNMDLRGVRSEEDDNMLAEVQALAAAVPDENRMPMLVLSNEVGINGAACLLYPGVTETIADRLQKDYFILPSSIHECIVIPATDGSEEDLGAMVRDINESQVPIEDVLSNRVYRFKIGATGQKLWFA